MRYQFTREGTWVYPSIQVVATTGDVIDAQYQIDEYWTLVDPATPATIASPKPDLPVYQGVPDGAFLIAKNGRFVPSQVAPFDDLGRVNEEGLPERLSDANIQTKIDTAVENAGLSVDLTPYQLKADKGQPNGYPSLDASGLIPAAQVPVADNSPQVQANTDAIAATDADLQGFKTLVPTNEDLLFCFTPNTGSLSADTSDFVGPMPFDITILSINFVFFQTLAADNTNFWKLEVNKVAPGPVATLMVRGTTEATGNDSVGAITTQEDWNFDGLTWVTRDVPAGNVLRFNWRKVGTPANLTGVRSCIIRYQRKAS